MPTPNRPPSQNKYPDQYMNNTSFDEDYGVNAVEILGEDSASGVLRKIQVTSSGSMSVTDVDGYNTNHIDNYTTTNVVYIGLEDSSAHPAIKKIDSTGNFPVFTYASVVNNPSLTTYATLWAARTTAVYGTYSEAF